VYDVETIGFESGKEYDIEGSSSESIKMLSAAAKEAGIWLVGGEPTYICDTSPMVGVSTRDAII
jgi:hypothetical protein